MHRTDLIEVSAWLTEPTEALGAQESDPHSNLLNLLVVLDDVKHILLMNSGESGTRGVPVLVEFYASVVGLHVVESIVGPVLEIGRIPQEIVTGCLEISICIEVEQRIPEPHDVYIL